MPFPNNLNTVYEILTLKMNCSEHLNIKSLTPGVFLFIQNHTKNHYHHLKKEHFFFINLYTYNEKKMKEKREKNGTTTMLFVKKEN